MPVEPANPALVAPTAPACSGTDVVAPKRLVRLTFNQIAHSLGSLVDPGLAEDVTERFELTSPLERTFPPLNNPREGSVIIDSQWQTGDAIAERAGQYVLDNFAMLSSCGDAPTQECAQAYADDFAERAYRRPLSADELVSYQGVFSAALTAGASATEAVQYSVYAALSAPQFLYRTEFGADSLIEGALDPYETASMLSYFVTDGPPDQALLDAAAGGLLATPDQLGTHVERLLQTSAARENLQTAMYSYFGIATLETIVIDPAVAPQFTEGLRSSMMRETELFLSNTLWNGTVADLLSSRTSYVNEGLADLYGIAYPPAGTPADADGFAAATLPEGRAGILTQPGYLTTRSSPDQPSVVRRGLLVNASLLCAENPVFPEAQADAIEAVVESLEGRSEREKAEYRATTAECAGCHNIFDAYGLALENFNVIGAYRDTDPEGRPIDASVTLPRTAGGGTVTTAAQMATEMLESGAFANCVSKNLLAYALAEGSNLSATSCATRAVAAGFAVSDQSFSALVREVAKSTTFTARSSGGAQ
jgi:hypothetical protein